MKKLYVSNNITLLAVSLLISFPLLFKNAIEYSYPMGYAGLFTQMAKQIAENNFRLPLTSPFYGPGGIPFAYPPLGLYGLAILIKLTGKYFIFLRLLPPLLSLISLIPLFYLTLELSGSSMAAVVTVILTATSRDLYIANAWAAGVTRAPAFIFMLASLYFFSKQITTPSRLNLTLTGVFLGLSIMSHLMYALFCVLWIWWWTLFSKRSSFREKMQDLAFFSVIGALTASVWLIPITARHGASLFLHVFDSHGGRTSLSFLRNIQGLFHSFRIHIEPLTSNNMIAILVLLGIIALLIKRQYSMILFHLFIILVFPENARFVFLLGCMIIGIGFSMLLNWFGGISNSRWWQYLAVISIIPILGMIYWSGLKSFSVYRPNLDGDTLDLARNIKVNMTAEQTYLALVKQDEAEWFPFLFQREPLVSQWGSEWLGAYNEQTFLTARFRDCHADQDWSCVENVISEMNNYPDVVITYIKDNRLNSMISASGQWVRIYTNSRYVFWTKND